MCQGTRRPGEAAPERSASWPTRMDGWLEVCLDGWGKPWYFAVVWKMFVINGNKVQHIGSYWELDGYCMNIAVFLYQDLPTASAWKWRESAENKNETWAKCKTPWKQISAWHSNKWKTILQRCGWGADVGLLRNLAEEERQQRVLKVGMNATFRRLWWDEIVSFRMGVSENFLHLVPLLPGPIRDFVRGCISQSGAEPDHDQGRKRWCSIYWFVTLGPFPCAEMTWFGDLEMVLQFVPRGFYMLLFLLCQFNQVMELTRFN